MSIKLIALDIDGTLINHMGEISQRNQNAIRRAREEGIAVVLATGRGRIATRPIWKELDLHGPSIQYGGAMIADIDSERALVLHEMDPNIIREVLTFAKEVDISAQIYIDDAVITEKTNERAEQYVARHKLPFIIDPDIRKKTFHNVPKVLAFAPIDRQDVLFAQFKERFAGIAQISRSSPGFIEINNIGITKATALEELSSMLRIPQEQTAAIGDNFLDQEMIEWAGLGACVADGAEAVKTVADLIVPACDEDGVAVLIEQYILTR
ncbi:MAG: Cof-type HAD-IIB family hydrolase [Christensenella sp.]|nr:Cof-type HAD-IIB family hydrolase [Christensenella sp.]